MVLIIWLIFLIYPCCAYLLSVRDIKSSHILFSSHKNNRDAAAPGLKRRVRLLADVVGLGRRGDIVHVSTAQWIYSLLPSKLAMIASDAYLQNLQMVEEKVR